MKSKNALCGICIALAFQLGMLAGFAQTNIYLYTGYQTNITLPAGTYIITAYGAPGGYPSLVSNNNKFNGGSGAEMSAEFNFSASTTLTLLVGGGGVGGYSGGGGGSYHAAGNGNVSTNGGFGFATAPGGTGGGGGDGYNAINASGGGGGGGSIIDSSAIAILAEVSGILSPDDPYNGEIIIIAVPPPIKLSLEMLERYPLLDLCGALGSNYMVQFDTNLSDTNWINLLSVTNLPSSPYPFIDYSGVGQPARFYRAFLMP